MSVQQYRSRRRIKDLMAIALFTAFFIGAVYHAFFMEKNDHQKLINPVQLTSVTPPQQQGSQMTTQEAAFPLPAAPPKPGTFQRIDQRPLDEYGNGFTLNKMEFLAPLKGRDYGSLNEVLQSYQEQCEKDFRKEYFCYEAFFSFAVRDSSIEPMLKEWKDKFPKEYAPYVASALYFETKGWESRGAKFAEETTDDQFRGMAAYHKVAAREAVRALELNPKLINPYVVLIGISQAQGDAAAGAAIVRKALVEIPNSFLIRRAYMLSLLPRWGGSYRHMEEFAEESERISDRNPLVKVLRGYIDSDRADQLRREDKLDGAIAAYTKAVSYGDHWYFYAERGEAYLYQKQYDLALADLDRAVGLRPQYVETLALRGYVHAKLGFILEARRDFDKANNLDPSNKDVRYWREAATSSLLVRGHELYKAKKLTEAISHYDNALHIEPRNAETYYWRAVAHAHSSSFDQAVYDLKTSIRLNPHHLDSYLYLDWILARRGQWDSIIAYWDQLIALEPQNARAYLERGGSYYHKKDFKASASDAKKACDLGNSEACTRYDQVRKLAGQ